MRLAAWYRLAAAGGFTFLQAACSAVFATYGCAVLTCLAGFPASTDPDQGLSYIFYLAYFKGKCDHLGQSEEWRGETAAATRTYHFLIVYAVFNWLWAVTSWIPPVVGWRKLKGFCWCRPGSANFCYCRTAAKLSYVWIASTALVLLLDIIGGIWYGVDIFLTLTPSDFRDFVGKEAGPLPNHLDNTFVPALVLSLTFLRGVVIAVFNVVACIAVFQILRIRIQKIPSRPKLPTLVDSPRTIAYIENNLGPLEDREEWDGLWHFYQRHEEDFWYHDGGEGFLQGPSPQSSPVSTISGFSRLTLFPDGRWFLVKSHSWNPKDLFVPSVCPVPGCSNLKLPRPQLSMSSISSRSSNGGSPLTDSQSVDLNRGFLDTKTEVTDVNLLDDTTCSVKLRRSSSCCSIYQATPNVSKVDERERRLGQLWVKVEGKLRPQDYFLRCRGSHLRQKPRKIFANNVSSEEQDGVRTPCFIPIISHSYATAACVCKDGGPSCGFHSGKTGGFSGRRSTRQELFDRAQKNKSIWLEEYMQRREAIRDASSNVDCPAAKEGLAQSKSRTQEGQEGMESGQAELTKEAPSQADRSKPAENLAQCSLQPVKTDGANANHPVKPQFDNMIDELSHKLKARRSLEEQNVCRCREDASPCELHRRSRKRAMSLPSPTHDSIKLCAEELRRVDDSDALSARRSSQSAKLRHHVLVKNHEKKAERRHPVETRRLVASTPIRPRSQTEPGPRQNILRMQEETDHSPPSEKRRRLSNTSTPVKAAGTVKASSASDSNGSQNPLPAKSPANLQQRQNIVGTQEETDHSPPTEKRRKLNNTSTPVKAAGTVKSSRASDSNGYQNPLPAKSPANRQQPNSLPGSPASLRCSFLGGYEARSPGSSSSDGYYVTPTSSIGSAPFSPHGSPQSPIASQ